MSASLNRHSVVVKKLLAGGAQVDLQNKSGEFAVTIAYQNQHENVKMLLSNVASNSSHLPMCEITSSVDAESYDEVSNKSYCFRSAISRLVK